jgi:peroxiredoxin
VVNDLLQLPADLPVPRDDGATDHLRGRRIPEDVELIATSGRVVRLADLTGITVLFIFPRMGQPGREPAGGYDAWNAIPGARGCTPHACSYRDHFHDLTVLGVRVFGLSAQSPADQREAAERLGLPFDLLSDVAIALGRRLRQPTFSFGGETLYRRHTLILVDGRIEHVFYPIFPPNEDATNVLAWLRARLAAGEPI